MHDPMTVAFSFLGITIWHVDPNVRGNDDSCDWWGRHRPLSLREDALLEHVQNLESTLDNRPHYDETHPTREHREFQELKNAVRIWRERSRWRLPVRWHVWHWRIQVDALLNFKRWAFSRCCKCGKGFSWGYSPCSNSWNGPGPRWFRSETNTYHSDCDDSRKSGVASEAGL